MNKHIKEGSIMVHSGRVHSGRIYAVLIIKKHENLFDVMHNSGRIYHGIVLGDGWVAL